ncbi:FAD-dependent 5-carboxymethylaminomethyl-2-thiouridine(34) oxidoreductase MnmC [Phycisphaeraceae bacterium D3-23]
MQDASDLTPHFDDAGRLVAPRYGDVYFSEAGGLAETTHVFLTGNRLAQRFERLAPGDTFTVGETGFGTGLNFLACWQLFDQLAPRGAALRFVTVEKHPLSRETMRQALSPWDLLRPYAYQLLKQYQPPGAPGSYLLVFDAGRVELTLLVGDAASGLATCQTPGDAWFLDGFTPARNPGMWSPAVFAEVARLSHAGTTLATYTAAGLVRRGLAAAGFAVEKRPGFGTKRDMTAGRMPDVTGDAGQKRSAAAPREALVVGAGVAGSFVARALADRGWAVTVVERQPMEAGEWPTLRRRVAIVQPKVGDGDDPIGRRLRDGFARVEQQLRERWGSDPRVGWEPCGVFHAAYDTARAAKLRRFVDQFGPAGLCRWIEPEETRDELGLTLNVGGVVIDSAGTLRPAGLCAALLDHPGIALRPGTQVGSLAFVEGQWCAAVSDGDALRRPVVIVASAMDALQLGPTRHLDLIPVRGQASLVPSAFDERGDLARLRRVICGAGYLTPAADGLHTMGASFVLNDTNAAWRDTEHSDVCDLFESMLPCLAQRLREAPAPAGWVGIRCTTPTRQPYAGRVAYQGRKHSGLYASLGHGSHGVVSACQSAHHIADAIEADTLAANR